MVGITIAFALPSNAGAASAGVLLFHRANRTIKIAGAVHSGDWGYARSTQGGTPIPPAAQRNSFADTVQTQAEGGEGLKFKKCPVLLVSAEGLEPSTP
jgi:hypothetical protein